MSKPPMKAVESIKKYCEKTQCRRCIFGESYTDSRVDYVYCRLQDSCPCEWELDTEDNDEQA